MHQQGLNFVTANLLDVEDGFRCNAGHRSRRELPVLFSPYVGHHEGLRHLRVPSGQYPDISRFLEAIPDIALFINTNNRCFRK